MSLEVEDRPPVIADREPDVRDPSLVGGPLPSTLERERHRAGDPRGKDVDCWEGQPSRQYSRRASQPTPGAS